MPTLPDHRALLSDEDRWCYRMRGSESCCVLAFREGGKRRSWSVYCVTYCAQQRCSMWTKREPPRW